MAVPVWSVTEIVSLSPSLSLSLLSQSYSCIIICAWQSADGRVTSDHCRVTVQWLFSKNQIAWNVQKTLFDSRPTVAWPPTTVAWPFSDFFQKHSNCLKRPKNVVWQSADGRVTSDHCRVTVQWLFSKKFQIAWNVQKPLFDSRPTVAWPPTTVAWPFSDFFQKIPKSLETSKNVVWQSADGRVTCPTTVETWPFSDFSEKKIPNCLKRPKTLSDSRPTVAWPPTTVAWPFSDFFQKISKLLETSKKRCLTVGRRSRDRRPLSRDRSVTFFKKFPNCLKRPKNVVWQSADGRVTSDHCLVTVQWLFSKITKCLKRLKNVFDSRPTVAWPPTTVAWPFSDFFQNISKWLETSKNVDWQSADGRVTSDHCRVTVQGLFTTIFPIAWNVQKTLFDSRSTVAWPPTTVAWPFSDFLQKISKLL